MTRCDVFFPFLAQFADSPILRERVKHVLQSLPAEVVRDFSDDPRFQVTIDNFEPGKGWTLIMDLPCPSGSGSRCVVLKRKLADVGDAFAHYVIAHEFAHAYLRNGGWGEIGDPEQAADALAASWGFTRPLTMK